MIGEFFTKTIKTVDLIIFVIPASLPRLTDAQKWIFGKVLEIFGKDIKENIVLALTFADGKKPPVLSAIESANVPYIAEYRFNNSAIYSENSGDETSFTRMFWKLGIKGFADLFAKLPSVKTKSLVLTREVIGERRKLETVVQGLRPQIDVGLGKLETARNVIDQVKHSRKLINENKNFNISMDEPHTEKRDLPVGQHTTTCLTCNRTCHANCAYANNSDKRSCSAMRADGHCAVCPQNCWWDVHANVAYEYIYSVKKKTVRSETLFAQYTKATSDKTKFQQVLEGLINEFVSLQQNILDQMGVVYQCLNRLREIALVDSPLSVADYIQQLILSEQAEKKAGWESRVASLHEFKKQQQFLKDLGQPGFDPFKKQKEELTKMLSQVLDETPTTTTPSSSQSSSSGWFGWLLGR